MIRNQASYTILNAVTPVVITSSTDATPIVITATSHGFSTGDLVMIYGHGTNIAANGIFSVTKLTANTFSLQDRYNPLNSIAGSGAGAGSGGICFPAPKIILCDDFTNFEFEVITSGTATSTIKFAASLGGTYSVKDGSTPNFGATQSAGNPYSFVQAIDLQNNAAVNGNDGIIVAGTDINNNYEVNINATKYLTAFPISWSAGVLTIKARAYSI